MEENVIEVPIGRICALCIYYVIFLVSVNSLSSLKLTSVHLYLLALLIISYSEIIMNAIAFKLKSDTIKMLLIHEWNNKAISIFLQTSIFFTSGLLLCTML